MQPITSAQGRNDKSTVFYVTDESLIAIYEAQDDSEKESARLNYNQGYVKVDGNNLTSSSKDLAALTNKNDSNTASVSFQFPTTQ
jgi:hypothetical protein